MNAEKLNFDNAKLDENALASGTILRDGFNNEISQITYSVHEKVADEIGAELFVHEFNEVAIYEVLNETEELNGKPLASIAHNLNAESDGEYVEERNLLHGYIRSDKLPKIDKAFSPEETDNFRAKANRPKKSEE